MENQDDLKEYIGEWAYDMSLKPLKGDGVVNVDVINQSIEMILTTIRGSRLFNLSFGSDFSLRIFDNIDADYLNRVIDDTVVDIQRWEDRIIILEKEVRLTAYPDKNMIHLSIPYIIKNVNILGEFSKFIKQ